MNIYVGNMPYSMTDAEVKELFGAYGTVDAVRIVMDRDSGRPKGFAFVEMNNADEANAAIAAIKWQWFWENGCRPLPKTAQKRQ